MKTEHDQVFIDRVIKQVERNISMGCKGTFGDHDKILRHWICGLERVVPMEFDDVVRQVNREMDPEYSDYVRLHQKFHK